MAGGGAVTEVVVTMVVSLGLIRIEGRALGLDVGVIKAGDAMTWLQCLEGRERERRISERLRVLLLRGLIFLSKRFSLYG